MSRELLLADLRHAGDALMLAPLIRGARKTHRVTVLCRPAVEPVFRLIPGVAAVLAWEPPWFSGGQTGQWNAIRKRLRERRFDDAASVWPDPRIHRLLAWSGAAERTGFAVRAANWYGMHLPWRRRRYWAARLLQLAWSAGGARPMLTRSLVAAGPEIPHLQRCVRLAAELGVDGDFSTPWLEVGADGAPEDLRRFVDAHRRSGREVWLIHPGARSPLRRWPVERWRELASMSRRLRNAAVLLADDPAAGSWRQREDRFFSWRPRGVEDLAAAMRLADAVAANDSFPAHLAAAMGRPVWTLFTDQEPGLFAPWNNRDRAVAVDVCRFRPCLDRCLIPSPVCRDELGVEHVARRIDAEEGAHGPAGRSS